MYNDIQMSASSHKYRDFQVDVSFIYADTCYIILQLPIVTDIKRRILVDGK